MTPKLDPAIVEALALDPSKTTIESYGSSGFASTFRITTTVNSKEKMFFVKIGKGKESEGRWDTLSDEVGGFRRKLRCNGSALGT